MPIFEYRCPICGTEAEDWRRIANRDDPLTCQCGANMLPTIITPPAVDRSFLGSTNMPGYKCVVTDEYVTTKKRRREIMAERGLEEAAPLSFKPSESP